MKRAGVASSYGKIRIVFTNVRNEIVAWNNQLCGSFDNTHTQISFEKHHCFICINRSCFYFRYHDKTIGKIFGLSFGYVQMSKNVHYNDKCKRNNIYVFTFLTKSYNMFINIIFFYAKNCVLKCKFVTCLQSTLLR